MRPAIFALLVTHGLVAAVLVLTLVLARRRETIGLGRCLLIAFVVGVSTVAFSSLRLVGPVRFGVFATMHLVWIAAAFAAPLAGLCVLAEARRGRSVTRPARGLAWASLLMIPTAVYAMVIEPRRLVFEEATCSARVPLTRSLRIGVLSDIQTSRVGAHERAACARLMAERPDVIVIAGDLFQGTQGHFERTREDFALLLKGLSAPGGVWVVRGDVDSDSDFRSYFDDITSGAGVNVLIDEPTRIDVDGQVLELYGYDRWGNDKKSLLAFLRTPREPGAARVVLAHRPDPVLWIDDTCDLDLFIAGHTHGGQVALPFFGPPVTMSDVPREVGAGGLHVLHDVPIYVSRGVGMERGDAPRVRFLCPPEVAVVTLNSR